MLDNYGHLHILDDIGYRRGRLRQILEPGRRFYCTVFVYGIVYGRTDLLL